MLQRENEELFEIVIFGEKLESTVLTHEHHSMIIAFGVLLLKGIQIVLEFLKRSGYLDAWHTYYVLYI